MVEEKEIRNNKKAIIGIKLVGCLFVFFALSVNIDSLFYLVAGVGLILIKAWARILALMIEVYQIGISGMGLYKILRLNMLGGNFEDLFLVYLYMAFNLIIAVLIIYFLTRPSIEDVFEKTKPPKPLIG